ncbi:MAG: DUF1553 domain-containing protein [Planctomycetales bacterium]
MPRTYLIHGLFAALAWSGLCGAGEGDAIPADGQGDSATAQADGAALPEGARHWSLQPVRRGPPPRVRDAAWPQSRIDRFILAPLEERGLRPAAPADRRTLLRRVTFDLTGLPPAPDELRAFLADDSPEAFVRVVDRLLASPRYGERWGRHWLDVARYADARDLIQLPPESDFREIWRYRDWVVGAFNRDLPYDQFVRMQIAGDLLQPADPHAIDIDALVATGLLALADFVPGDVDKEQMIADYVNDQIDVMGRAIMGLTLGCARCHDHKYDPISTEDYYALAGIFFSTRLIPGPIKGNTPLVRAPLMAPARRQALEAEQARDKQRLAELPSAISQFAERYHREQVERQITGETSQYASAAWVWMHRPSEAAPGTLEDFASQRQLDPAILARWLQWLQEQPPLPALAPLLAAENEESSTRTADELGNQLSALADRRREVLAADPVLQQIAGIEILRFRADDRRLVANAAGEIVLWPDRGGSPQDAKAKAQVPGPVLAQGKFGDTLRPVVRFQGQASLQVPRVVPEVGSLFVVYRSDPAAAGDQRLIGWEDSSAGQHGLGLMTAANGGLHAILRRNGASGDIVMPPPASPDFQLVSLTWGPAGVALFRNGEPAGTSQGITAVSSDPAITALAIGGPGSGGSARFRGDLAELRVYAAPLEEMARLRIEAELKDRWFGPSPVAEAPLDPIDELLAELLSSRSPYWGSDADRARLLPKEASEQLAALSQELEQLKNKPTTEIPRAVVVLEGGPADTKHSGFHDAQVAIRGNPANPGPTVPRGVPRVLAGAHPPTIREGSGRRELADWLTSPAHPLTARVIVNRLWQHHFGEGLVRTSTNFGVRGEVPSHPELLDELAGMLVDSGWSIKELHRAILLSSVYQQSSRAAEATRAADPENRLLGRLNRRRLDAEAIRDSLLAAANRLDETAGGPGFLDPAIPRRSLYLMSVRTGAKASEFCPLFDGPDGGGVIERRHDSVVAPQALFLMNDPLVNDLATALARRVVQDQPEGTPDAWIERLFEIALGRPATAAEMDIGRGLAAQEVERLANAGAGQTTPEAVGASEAATIGPPGWLERLCLVILLTNEFVYVD